MKTRIIFSILTLQISLALAWCALSEGKDLLEEKLMTCDILSKRLNSFVLEKASIKETVSKLREHGLRICFEEVEKTNKEADVENHLISLELRDKTVEKILNEIAVRTSQYTWKRHENTNILIIFPKSGSVLNWKVPALKAKNRSIMDLLEKDDILDLKRHNIIFFYRGFTQPLDIPITIDLQDKPVMDSLNNLINSHPRLCWTIQVNPRGKRILTMHFLRLR